MTRQSSQSSKKMVTLSILAAISVILMFFEIPLPFLPPFLKLDFSAVPILIGGLSYGPLAAVIIVGIKDFVHLLLGSSSLGVGQLADFLILGSFAFVTSFMYKKIHTKHSLVLSFSVGTIIMSLVGVITNYFILLPFYAKMYGMSIESIIEMSQKVNPAINSMQTYLLIGVLPFNLIKGILASVITYFLYKRLSKFMQKDKFV